MSKRLVIPITIATLIVGAVFRSVMPALQSSRWLWLVVTTIGAPWIVWDSAKNLYTASMYGYVTTGVPERRLYRDEDQRLFRNNVIVWIVLHPAISAGAVVVALDAWEAVS